MPYFKVTLEGTGIQLPVDESRPPAVGFFTTRWVNATDSQQAQEIVASAIRAEWTCGEYSENNGGSVPLIETDYIERVGIFEFWLRRKRGGYGFYAAGEDETAA